VLLLSGLCVAAFVNTPDREIEVRLSELELGIPKFLAVTSFGHDQFQRTFGAYLAVPETEVGAVALFSRDPDSGCNLRWEGATSSGTGRGVYADPCSDARYDFDGTALHEDATRDLHRFAVRREANRYVVTFEELTLGACRGDHTEGCSGPGPVERRSVPRGMLPADFGTR
jgi:hypothetical protein